MRALLDQRCFNHAQREAAARCPGCGRFFCRECVTEHEGKLLCAACLRRAATPAHSQRGFWVGWGRAAAALGGLVIAWLFFYLVGQALLAVPSSYHEGTVWRDHWVGAQ